MLFNRFAVRNGVDSCICRRAVAWLSRLYDHCVCSCAYMYTLVFQACSFHVSVYRFWVCISIGIPPRAAKQGMMWEAASNTIPFAIVFLGPPCGLSCNTTRTHIHCQWSQVGSQMLGRMSAPFLATPLAWCGRTARLGLCDSSKLLCSMVRRKKRWLSRRRCCICRCIIVVAGWAAAKKKDQLSGRRCPYSAKPLPPPLTPPLLLPRLLSPPPP